MKEQQWFSSGATLAEKEELWVVDKEHSYEIHNIE